MRAYGIDIITKLIAVVIDVYTSRYQDNKSKKIQTITLFKVGFHVKCATLLVFMSAYRQESYSLSTRSTIIAIDK